MLCPKTLKACPDDLCRGSGCMAYPGGGVEMIPTCHLCGAPMMTDDGEPDNSGTICDECVERDGEDDNG